GRCFGRQSIIRTRLKRCSIASRNTSRRSKAAGRITERPALRSKKPRWFSTQKAQKEATENGTNGINDVRFLWLSLCLFVAPVFLNHYPDSRVLGSLSEPECPGRSRSRSGASPAFWPSPFSWPVMLQVLVKQRQSDWLTSHSAR